jgi:charged multivesicular body protein 4A/B
MKKKKLYENEMEKITNVKMTLETQIFHVESSVYNSATISAMSEGTKTMKMIHAQTGVEKVEDMLDEIREEAELGQELSNAFRQPLDFMMDDDELLAELEGMSFSNPVSSTPSKISMLPSAPTNRIKLHRQQKDEDDLKRLEQELLA